MKGRGASTGGREFFCVLSLLSTGFLLLLAMVPGSPGYLRPTVVVAVGLGVVTVAAVLAVPASRRREMALVSSAMMTTAVTIALVGAERDALALSLLFWFPWAGSYAGLVWRRFGAVMGQAALVAAVGLGAFSAHGRLAAFPFVGVGCALSVLACAYVTYGSLQRGRGPCFSDSVTDLTNRAGLLQAGDPVLSEIMLAGRQALLMIVNIDHFREINTALGYEAGDEVLRMFARRLRSVRPAPSCVGRLGGDEFALVMPGASQVADGVPAPERTDSAPADVGRAVLDQLDGRLRISGVDVEVEATAGLAVAPWCGDRIATLLPCADAALSDARRGGERVGVWRAEMVGVQPWELALHAQLRSAITRGELVLHYQPMQEAATGRIVDVEALLRWRHPDRGLLPPGSFLPMAERSSLIVDLTWWELDEALRQCARWRTEGLRMPVSANLSARMLVVDELPRVVAERLAAHDLPADMLTLEITESALISQPARAAAMLSELRITGVKLSMDDFGTGYNSMEILKALPFDEVKIDRGFVSDARRSLPDAAIVRSVIDLGHRLGMRVVGEGVEDEHSERMLTELGCDLLQGEALSPPLPARKLPPLLASKPRVTSRSRAPAPTSTPTRAAGLPQKTPPGALQGQESAIVGEHSGEQAAAQVGETGIEQPAFAEATTQAKAHWTRSGLSAAVPADEEARLAALRGHHVLDTPPEPEFDALATLAAQIADCTYAHVVFVDAGREWFKSCHGLRITELGARVGVASHTVASGTYLEVPDATRDLRFARVVRSDPNLPVRFFAGVPLRTPEGHVLGALCVSDRLPRRLAPGQRHALHQLATQTMRLLDARRERQTTEEITTALHTLDQLWYPDDLPTAATLTADIIRSLAGADAVAVMLAEMPGSTVFHAAGSSVAPGTEPLLRVGIRATPDDEAALRALSHLKDAIFIPDPERTPLIPTEMVRKLNIRSALVIPLPGEGGLLGLITVRWTHPLTCVEPSLLQAITLFATSARYTLHRLQAACRRRGEWPPA